MLTILGSGELGADEEPSTFRENYIGDVGAVAVCSYPSKQGPDLPIDRRFKVDAGVLDRFPVDCPDQAGEADLLAHICFRGISFD